MNVLNNEWSIFINRLNYIKSKSANKQEFLTTVGEWYPHLNPVNNPYVKNSYVLNNYFDDLTDN